MRIAFVSQYPECGAAPRGGVEGVVVRLVGFLAEQGIECHVVAVDSESDGVEHAANGVTVHRLRRSRVPGALQFWSMTPWRVRKVVRRIAPDVTHVHGAAIWAALLPGSTVLTIHGAPEREIAIRHPVLGRVLEPFVRWIETTALRRVRNIVLINPFVRRFRSISTRHRVFEIANPIDAEFFAPLAERARRPTKELRLVWVGSEHRLKNLRSMIAVVASLRQRDVEVILEVVGVGGQPRSRYGRACVEQMRAYGVSERIVLHGRLSTIQVREAMDRADIIVLTSVQENAPCVVSEALARGLYVVAPQAFGLPSMIPNVIAGSLYSRDSAPAVIADVIEGVITTGVTTRRDARAALAEQYRIDIVGHATMRAYRAILEG